MSLNSTGAPELGEPLFHFFFLDDELNTPKGVNAETYEMWVRQFLLMQKTDEDDLAPLPVSLVFTKSPEELLSKTADVIGKKPFAAVIDFNLMEAKESSYANEAGGFQVWAALKRQSAHLPSHLAPRAIIYTAKPEILKYFGVVQPSAVGEWVWEQMEPSVLEFNPVQANDYKSLMPRLLKWLAQTRTRLLRQWGDEDISFLRTGVALPKPPQSEASLSQEWPEEQPDPMTVWKKKRSFKIPGTSDTWRGCLATLFPEYTYRVGTQNEADYLQVCAEVARALGVSLPDCTRLLGRFISENTKDLKKDSRFKAFEKLPPTLTKFDHLSRTLTSNDPDPILPVLELIQPLYRDFLETSQACGLTERQNADDPHSIPNGLHSFLDRLQELKPRGIAQLDDVINGSGGNGRIPNAALGWARWHLAGIVPKGKVPAGLWFLDADVATLKTAPPSADRATTLLNQFTAALKLAGPQISRRFPDDDWREFLWYFPLPAEVGWVIRRVVDLNRKHYGKDVPGEWFTAIQLRTGARGGLALQILAKTQDEDDPIIDYESVKNQILLAKPHPEKLSGLHAVICGQYGGIIRLLQGANEIEIWHRRLTPGSGLQPHGILSNLGGSRYPPKNKVPTVAGAWYLIEIESREMDE